MTVPLVHFVATRDGYEIAYTDSGIGFPVVFMPALANHVEEVWHECSGVSDLFQELSQRYRLINYDARGMGLSSRKLTDAVTLDAYLHDLEAVVAQLEVERFVLVGPKNFGLLALQYARRHPEQVSALVLLCTPFRWLPAIWEDLAGQDWEIFLHIRVPRGYSSRLSKQLVKMLSGWISQADYLSSIRVWQEARNDPQLYDLETPALVLQPHDVDSALAAAHEATAALPNGCFHAIETGYPFGVAGEVMGAMERFLAGEGIQAAVPSGGHGTAARRSSLSPREIEVLCLVATGKSNAQIAEELVISQHTVIRHVANIFMKTGVSNRTQAATYAHQNGLA